MKHNGFGAVALLSVLGLVACGPKDERKAENAVDDTQNAMANAAEATGNAIDNASLAMMPTPSAQEFADKAAKSDAFEIEASKLATTNAASPQVKAFAKMMTTAHTESTAKVKTAAAEVSPAVTPDATLTADQSADLAKLKALKGAEFDKEYVDEQVDAHEDALALMTKYAADGTAPSLKKAASEIAPVVQQHLTSIKLLDSD